MAENLGEENVFNENIKFSFGQIKGGALDEDEDDDEVRLLYSVRSLCGVYVFLCTKIAVVGLWTLEIGLQPEAQNRLILYKINRAVHCQHKI